MSGPDQHQDDKTAVFGRTAAIDNRPESGVPGSAPRAKLICLEKDKLPDPAHGAEIDLIDKEQTIGRTPQHNTMPINATGISKRHARVFIEKGAWRVEDLGSTNGVFVNDAKIQNAPLNAGDTVKIGKIKFQFVLVRPDIKAAAMDKDGKKHEEFDPDKTVSERTMFVGSNLMAAAMLLDAKAKQEQAAARPASGGAARMAATPASVQTRRKGGWLGKAVAALVVVAAVGGGVYWFGGFGGGASQRELTASFQSEIKRFVRDNEGSAGSYSGAAHEQQSTELANIRAGLNDALTQYPGAAKLSSLQAQALFLQFERTLLIALQTDNLDAAQQALAQARTEFDGLKAAGVGTKEQDVKQVFSEVGGLLDLADPVIQIKLFVKHFPNPTKGATPQPEKAQVDNIAKMRSTFAQLKKKNNLALSLSFPFFSSIVKVVDEKDVIVIDKWGNVMAGR